MRLWIPAERFAAIVDAHAKPHPNSNMARKLFDLRNGRQQFVSLEAADRMLTELDLSYLLHIPKDQGGLADIYVEGIQYGRPQNHLAFTTPRRYYATDEERVAARRASWRESKKRARRDPLRAERIREQCRASKRRAA